TRPSSSIGAVSRCAGTVFGAPRRLCYTDWQPMPTFREMVLEAQRTVPEVTPEAVAAELTAAEPPVLLDVREPDETAEGHLPGALLLPRAQLELAVGRLVPRTRGVVVCCQGGMRSLLAGVALGQLGYTRVASLAGGYGRWSDLGLPSVRPEHLPSEQKARYRRHLTLPEVGEAG